jgi:hypothetical protein
VILVDTSVWVEHLRHGNARLVQLLHDELAVCHPFVVGELAMGSLRNRAEILDLLQRLPTMQVASHAEVLTLVERRHLNGAGLGWIDAHLLTSTILTGRRLWSLDRRLADAAQRFDVAPRLNA